MKKFVVTVVLISIAIFVFINFKKEDHLPVIAIANYGPHITLEDTVSGFKRELAKNGFIENKNIRFEVLDVSFDPSLIPQMLASLKAKDPKIMLVLTTPVAQMSKKMLKDIPLVYADVADPVQAGLISNHQTSGKNMTGSSDMQDLEILLSFAKTLLPNARKVGLLYSTAESNDDVLLRKMREAGDKTGFKVVAVPVDQSRDIPVRMQQFKGKVDFIYVGSSGPIQPALPSISAEARKMNIPVFNMESKAVKEGLALASFGVDYIAVGRNAGELAVKILNGGKVSSLKPSYPDAEDHKAFVNKKLAKKFSIKIPKNSNLVG
ncbi:MAG: ABC transporter substrate-binding protein [Rickettsiales bacterium]